MKISSIVFEDNGNIPEKYTCKGESVNPPLSWEGVPVNTRSLALIVDDPDAPMGVFSHWVLWDIPVHVGGVEENSVPVEAVVGVSTSGVNQYVAPCPPSGVHHYRFKLYALDKELFLSIKSTQEDLEAAMDGHILDQAQLVGLFQK
ncbi:MAG: hypothetical protein ACD_72C00289G0004 [uncultured bacterium]|nr:MAG: hypothetical protein ACD_72C00289G0004 [uncultured bacterium]